ncbi:hypothetical protein MRX96_006704 [Rhipicephalus microplus]
MCATVAEVKDRAANGADKNDGMVTASFEAAQLFNRRWPTAGVLARPPQPGPCLDCGNSGKRASAVTSFSAPTTPWKFGRIAL